MSKNKNPAARDFGPRLMADHSVTSVNIDAGVKLPQTKHGFISLSATTHPPIVPQDTPSETPSNPQNIHKLHPDCDADVRDKVVNHGWTYIENDLM